MAGEVRVAATENEQIVRRLVEDSVNANRPDALDTAVDPDVRVHPGTPGAAPDTRGIEDLRAAFRAFHTVFPDLHVELHDVITADDRVAARWTASGTHLAELAGVPATGRFVRWGGIDVYRLVEGKIVDWWRNEDFVGLLRQLSRDPSAAAVPGER